MPRWLPTIPLISTLRKQHAHDTYTSQAAGVRSFSALMSSKQVAVTTCYRVTGMIIHRESKNMQLTLKVYILINF